MIRTFLFLSLLTLLSLALPAFADKLQSCYDGDTCWMLRPNGQRYKIRLSGVDCPEKKQDYGLNARARTIALLSSRHVRTSCKGRSWDRKNCFATVNGQDLGSLLVREGLAWDSPKYSHGHYSDLQRLARQERRGLWVNPSPKSPYCFRHPKEAPCRVNREFMP